MDSNGTRFHLLLGREDWGRCRAVPEPFRLLDGAAEGADAGTMRGATEYDPARDELRLRAAVFRFRQGRPDEVPAEARRGAARDRYGNVYWVSEDRRSVRVASAGCGDVTTFWPREGS